MSSPNKTSTFIRTDYAEEPTQNIRRCRFIAHIADLSALIGINPTHYLAFQPEHLCHPERSEGSNSCDEILRCTQHGNVLAGQGSDAASIH